MTFNIYKVGITALTILLLNACGGGGDSTPVTTPEDPVVKDPAPIVNKETKLELCSDKFTVLKKGATITSLENDTKLTIRHKQDGTREACINSGKTKIN